MHDRILSPKDYHSGEFDADSFVPESKLNEIIWRFNDAMCRQAFFYGSSETEKYILVEVESRDRMQTVMKKAVKHLREAGWNVKYLDKRGFTDFYGFIVTL